MNSIQQLLCGLRFYKLLSGVGPLTLAPEEAKHIKEVVQKFLCTVHSPSICKIDFDEMKREKDKIAVHGSYQISKSRLRRAHSVTFRMELDNDDHLLYYVRERIT